MRRESESWLVERAVLAACLRDSSGSTRDKVAANFDPIYFQDEECRRTWKSIESLQTPIDELSLAQSIGPLTLEHWGGLKGLYELANTVPHTGLVDRHMEILRKLNHRPAHEEAMTLAKRDMEDGHDPEHALKRLEKLKEAPSSLSDLSIADAAKLAADHFLAIDSGDLAFLATPWAQLNTILGGGLMPGLIVIAARPSVGKTALALSLATHYAQKMTVAFLSLEMSASQLAGRVIQATQSIHKPTGRNFYAPDHRIKLRNAPEKLQNLHLRVFDSLHEIGPAASAIEALRPKVAFIDYLQLLEGPSGDENRAAQVSAISRSLKLLSLKMDLPIVALAQLNRESEKTGRSPRLSDLRESGSIEQDCDVCMFISRIDEDDTPRQDVKIEVAKNRSGPTGRLKLTFDRNFQTWTAEGQAAENRPPF